MFKDLGKKRLLRKSQYFSYSTKSHFLKIFTMFSAPRNIPCARQPPRVQDPPLPSRFAGRQAGLLVYGDQGLRG